MQLKDRKYIYGADQLDAVCKKFINTVMDFYDIPGIAVGVYVGDYVFTGSGGYRNHETKAPMQPDTVFHCTSVSKLFTAMGIMKLVEQEKLSLSDRLCDAIPWLPIVDKRWKNITIESMLTHTSGFTDVNDYHWREHRVDENALKDYALSDEVSGRKLLWEPAEGYFRYSSMAYDILGLVIAEVSGVSFEEFMESEIFEPLGMDDTTFLTSERIKECMSDAGCEGFIKAADQTGLAMPHSKGRDRVIRIEEAYPYTRQHAPSSTLTSTTGDLLKWAGGLLHRAPLGETSAEARCTPLDENTICDMWMPRGNVPDTGEQMGLGWFVRKQTVLAEGNDGLKDDKYTFVGHEGSDDGFRTSFWICPELGVATVLLCNLTDAPLKKLSERLLESVAATFMYIRDGE